MTRDKEVLRVLLIKDQAKKEGFDYFIEKEGKINVVGEATNPIKAVEIANKQLPDIVLIESSVAPSRSIEIIKRLKETHPQINIILISFETEEKYVSEALQAGASGYIIKTNIGSELSEAVSRIEAGQVYLSRFIPKAVIKEYQPQRVGRKRTEDGELTGRQKDILTQLAQGYTNKQIAQRFNLSVKTVDAHRANIMSKLKIHDLPGLVKYAIRVGLTTVED